MCHTPSGRDPLPSAQEANKQKTFFTCSINKLRDEYRTCKRLADMGLRVIFDRNDTMFIHAKFH